MNFGVIVFPGSNGDHDALRAIGEVLGQPVRAIWHRETELEGIDCVVVPGGFAYGDYLRAGAIARFSPIMAAVERFARAGGPVLGICNGFQVLTEAGLLPGALLRNANLEFRCQWLHVRTERTDTSFTSGLREGQVLRLLADGMSVAGIAKQLFVSESTAKTHISKLYEKLGAGNRAQALMTAMRLGLIPTPRK